MLPIIILGNGHSTTTIDYKKLPSKFHTFRVNNFYFEDHYYLGKQVDYYLCGAALLEDQFFNITYLQNNKEYNIDQFYIHNHDQIYQTNNYKYYFPSVNICNEYLKCIPHIYQLLRYHEFYHSHAITAGTIAILTAIGLGYKEIYIAGIDFYNNSFESAYPFPLGEKFINIRQYKYQKTLDSFTTIRLHHNLELDKEIMQYIINHTDIQLFSIINDSINLIPIASDTNSIPYKIESKPKSYLNDWLYLPKDLRDGQFIYQPKSLTQKQKIKQIYLKKISESDWEYLRQNYFIKLIFNMITSFLRFIHILYKLIT